MNERIERTMENLKRNNMIPYYCETREDALKLVREMLPFGAKVANGGSQTLEECGIIKLLKGGDYEYLDRSAQGLSPIEVTGILHRAFISDYYLSSSNAITENGELYNVDGNSNRVAAMLFGPKNVIVVAGINKLVKNISEAELRVKKIAAPKNCLRLKRDTPCAETGECYSLGCENRELSSGCPGESRICCNYVIMSYQRRKDRVKVIIIGEELGF